MDRSCSTTYEEKVQNMRGKKRARYEENMKKQQPREEDNKFYSKMKNQGGTGL